MLLVSGRFPFSKTIIPDAKEHFLTPSPRRDAHLFGGLGLSELGKAAEQECTVLIADSDIPTKPAGDSQSRAARKMLRHEWQPNSKTAQAIEVALAELLSDPEQATLAERQMQAA